VGAENLSLIESLFYCGVCRVYQPETKRPFRGGIILSLDRAEMGDNFFRGSE
jgi:hypothetical protein